ncbi:hypothetical protein HYU89_01350 [Candidatus Collierbacteria bacterium]|nr:hypothetical protein [Candidatus Collierbacteria bacterium]
MFISLSVLGVALPGGERDLFWSDPLAGRGKFDDIGTTITSLLPYLFIIGGIVTGGMLIIGGFDILTSMGSEEKLKSGAERIKNALIGFLLLFAVYWLAQIAQVLFKIPIL